MLPQRRSVDTSGRAHFSMGSPDGVGVSVFLVGFPSSLICHFVAFALDGGASSVERCVTGDYLFSMSCGLATGRDARVVGTGSPRICEEVRFRAHRLALTAKLFERS